MIESISRKNNTYEINREFALNNLFEITGDVIDAPGGIVRFQLELSHTQTAYPKLYGQITINVSSSPQRVMKAEQFLFRILEDLEWLIG